MAELTQRQIEILQMADSWWLAIDPMARLQIYRQFRGKGRFKRRVRKISPEQAAAVFEHLPPRLGRIIRGGADD